VAEHQLLAIIKCAGKNIEMKKKIKRENNLVLTLLSRKNIEVAFTS